MMNMKDGGPAFPIKKDLIFKSHEAAEKFYGENPDYHTDGMSLRDYFAAKAMQGMLASWYSVGDNYDNNGLVSETVISEESYIIADAMLEAREK